MKQSTGSAIMCALLAATLGLACDRTPLEPEPRDLARSAAQDECSFSISPTSQDFSADGGTASVTVTTLPHCAWTAISQDEWITVTAGDAGTGSGIVNYSVAGAAIGPCARSGSIAVAAQTFTIRQATGPQECNTAPGSDIIVQLAGVTLRFNQVTASGTSIFTPGDPCVFQPGDPCQDLPAGFSNFGNRAFDIQTTATFSGPITIEFDLSALYPVDPVTPALVSTLRVFHVENGVLLDRTFPIDPIIPVDPVRVAVVTSLSPFVIAQQPPRAALQSTQADLRVVRQTFNSAADALRLHLAIQSLTLALNAHLWRDPTHLQPLTGAAAYVALKGAILSMHGSLKDATSSIPDATARFYIDRILQEGRRLADTAISDARAAGGSQHAIDRATRELGEGDAAVARSDFEEAMVHYALAWAKAQLALGR